MKVKILSLKEKQNKDNIHELILGKYSFVFKDEIEFEIYNVPDNYCGLIFTFDKQKYDIVMHIHLGYRMLIKGNGELKDMPFNLDTAKFLPNNIKVGELP